MKNIVRTKLSEHNDRKYVELRDYEIEGQDKIKVIHNDEYMILTKSQLKQGHYVNTQKSQFPPYAYYKMIEYLWKPIKNLDEKPTSTVNVMLKMAETPAWEKLREKLHS